MHNLEKVRFFKKNVHQPVEFINILMLKQQSILRLISTKFPEMEIFGFLEKFITYAWFRGQRLKIYPACTNVCHSLEVCNKTTWTNFLMG